MLAPGAVVTLSSMRTLPPALVAALALVLALVVAACGGGAVAPLVEADASSAADSDASPVDARQDADGGEDAGAVELDAGEVLVDAGHDAGADAGPVGRDAGYVGECSLVPQSGCADGEACRLSGEESAVCGPVNYDAGGEFARCALSDECLPGFVCVIGECTRLCLVGMACPSWTGPRGTIELACRESATPPVGTCRPR